jgi:ABC-type amino acid transport substrate-binding protein
VLRVAVPERAEPPFLAYGADGQPDGYDPAVARLLAAALGAQAVLVPTPDGRAGVLATVRSGRAQLGLARLSLDRKAARQVAFSRPYAAPPRAVLYPRLRLARAIPGAPPERLLERPGTVVAVVREDLAGAYLAEAFPDARALVLDGLAAAAAALRTGQAQLLLSDRPRLLGWLAQHPGLALELGYRELPGTRDAVVIALGWDAQRLAGWLDTALEVLEADGTLPALRRRHLEPAAGGSP